jgi:hypothetical protein
MYKIWKSRGWHFGIYIHPKTWGLECIFSWEYSPSLYLAFGPVQFEMSREIDWEET